MRLKSTLDSNGIIPLAFELLFRKDDYISPPVFRNSCLLHLLFIKIDWRLKRSNCRSSRSQMFLKVGVRNIHTKTPVLESKEKRETPTQVFFCEYYESFKNSSHYRIPPLATSKTGKPGMIHLLHGIFKSCMIWEYL